jgi:hypothetical protein
MKPRAIDLLAALMVVIGNAKMGAQSKADKVETHVAAAKSAAGHQHVFLFNSLCAGPSPPSQQRPAPTAQPGPPRPNIRYMERMGTASQCGHEGGTVSATFGPTKGSNGLWGGCDRRFARMPGQL